MKENKTLQAGGSALARLRDRGNSRYCILVVDDDKDTRQLSVDVLAGSGYDVEAVQDGAACWEIVQTRNYDLIITDNRMPRMTGIEIIEKLRSACMAIPVIMATGCLPTYELARKPWLKPDVLLEKPITNDDLLEAVKKVLPAPAKTRARMQIQPFPEF
jgi:CheY-like chemotaxis protein